MTVEQEIAHVRVILLDRKVRRDGTPETPRLSDDELLDFFKRALYSILDRNSGWFDGSADRAVLDDEDKLDCIYNLSLTPGALTPLNNKYRLAFEQMLLQWINLQNTPTVRAETYTAPTDPASKPQETTLLMTR